MSNAEILRLLLEELAVIKNILFFFLKYLEASLKKIAAWIDWGSVSWIFHTGVWAARSERLGDWGAKQEKQTESRDKSGQEARRSAQEWGLRRTDSGSQEFRQKSKSKSTLGSGVRLSPGALTLFSFLHKGLYGGEAKRHIWHYVTTLVTEWPCWRLQSSLAMSGWSAVE